MTERKPADVNFESWIDRQIREATERGEFDNLPGTGKPLPGGPVEEQWWLKDYLRREGLPSDVLLPTPLLLRKEVEALPETVRGVRTEAEVRDLVAELNLRIVEWLRFGDGPRVPLAPVNVDKVVRRWHDENHRPAPVPAPPEPPPVRWWHRWTRPARESNTRTPGVERSDTPNGGA